MTENDVDGLTLAATEAVAAKNEELGIKVAIQFVATFLKILIRIAIALEAR